MSADDDTTSDDDAGVPKPQADRLARKREMGNERAAAAAAAEAEDRETVRFRIYRYDPDDADQPSPRYDDFHVPFERGMTVLDGLIHARDEFDPSLTFRHSCRQAICGSDALFINGRQRLACKTQVADLSRPIQVEPLPHLDVEKDLVVEMEHFYDQMHAVEPYFDPDEAPVDATTERRQSPANREHIKMSTRCIWCASCHSSCNLATGENYLGPAAVNMAYRFAMDEREGDRREDERYEIIKAENGVWRCQTQFSCTEVCPKDIPLTEHIQELKRSAVQRNLKFW